MSPVAGDVWGTRDLAGPQRGKQREGPALLDGLGGGDGGQEPWQNQQPQQGGGDVGPQMGTPSCGQKGTLTRTQMGTPTRTQMGTPASSWMGAQIRGWAGTPKLCLDGTQICAPRGPQPLPRADPKFLCGGDLSPCPEGTLTCA